jgi:hypothetical protein
MIGFLEESFTHALMITGFVFMMMLVIEYLNVLSRGLFHQELHGSRLKQYLLASFLGATPGCLGAFAAVTLYSHRVFSLGAVVAAMIATSGDEAFIMLSLIPEKALLIFLILFLLAIFVGFLTDTLLGDKAISLLFGILSGKLGPTTWNWIRITLFMVSGVALFIVSTVPEHFLEEHLWEHIAKIHVPRIFFWTFSALFLMHILIDQLHLEGWIQQNQLIVLAVACLVGVIPESGPHLIFLTLFYQNAIPFSILLASSVVQDGHGMLRMVILK